MSIRDDHDPLSVVPLDELPAREYKRTCRLCGGPLIQGAGCISRSCYAERMEREARREWERFQN